MNIKYDQIGVGYNRTRTADPYLLERIQFHLDPNPSEKFLDVGCGTGNYTRALSESGISMTGVDPSQEMLSNANSTDSDVEWIQGTAESLPFAAESFSGVLASLTIHHWSNLEVGFQEINRVLEPDGRLIVFTATPEQMKGYWLNHYFPRMMEASMLLMPALQTIKTLLVGAGFERVPVDNYEVRPDLKDLFLYSGKFEPELYLDAQVRQGISSFAALADAEEVANGLRSLKSDLASGDFESVANEYANDGGDYLFIVAQK